MQKSSCSPSKLVLAGVAMSLLLVIIVSASQTPSKEECRPHIDKEKKACQSPLSDTISWLSDMLFAEKRLLKQRDEAIEKRERDLVRLKVQRGELPKEALNRPLKRHQSESTDPTLMSRLWTALFAESQYIKQRDEAIQARERDLLRHKKKGGEKIEPQIEIPPEMTPSKVKKPEVVKPQRTTPPKILKKKTTPLSNSVPTTPSSGGFINDMLFAETHYMKIREQAMAARQQDLIRSKVEQGELPEEALYDPSWKYPESDKNENNDKSISLWDMLFSEQRLFSIRKQAMKERHYDLVRSKVERGELEPEALEYADEIEDSSTDETSSGPSIWNMLFSESRLMEIRKQAMAERQLNFIRMKVEQGEMPPEALDNPEESMQSVAEDASGGLSLWNMIFSEGRLMNIRNQAMAERQLNFIRMKVEQGEMSPEALDNPEQSIQTTTDKTSDGLSVWDMIFSEGRLMKIRKQAMAERQLNYIRMKVEQGEMPPEALDTPEQSLQETTDKTSDGLSLWDMIFSEGRLMKIRQKAMNKRTMNLIQTKVENSELPPEALDKELGSLDTVQPGEQGIIPRIVDAIFAHGRHMEVRKRALAERHRNFVQAKVARGELPREALEQENIDQVEADTSSSESLINRVSNEIFAESRYMELRNKAIAEREAHLKHFQAARGRGDLESFKTTPAKTSSPVKPVTASQPTAKQLPGKPTTVSPSVSQPAKKTSPPVSKPPPPMKPSTTLPTAKPAAQTPSTPTAATVPEQKSADVEMQKPTARPRHQVEELLALNTPHSRGLEAAATQALQQLKQLADYSIKPLEDAYKYSDISPRNLGESELFAKPMILFLGQLNSGKSTMINYLLGTEATKTTTLPGSGQFRVLTHGNLDERHDGAQVVRRWEFAGLQQFGEGLIDRLSGRQLTNKLLEKANIVDVPGIMEGRQYNRLYPFNDVCQWFIDRADIIFVVFDPHHLDIGMEMENLLDQLKGRENQVRIVLNKADQVTPADLMRLQSGLIWSLSPLLGSGVPPPIFSGSFIAQPYQHTAPAELFRSQEDALLRDIADGLANRVVNRIGLTRRHAVRVRNHARMVDCYLTTYLNQLTFLSNKKRLADDIVANPHKYHIYEGISRLTNISRYDLPDPELYEEFFSLHALYDFPTLESTCTFFKGCPLDTLDQTIQSTLPDLLSKYQKKVDASRRQT